MGEAKKDPFEAAQEEVTGLSNDEFVALLSDKSVEEQALLRDARKVVKRGEA